MRRNTTFARGSHVPAATLNALQDEQLGLVPASDAPATLLKGADLRWWTTPDVGIADGILRVVDASIDWKHRRLLGLFRNLGAANRRPGQADDHVGNDPALTVAARSFDGWTGAGAVGAASATVVSGVPPVLADDAFAVVLDEGATAADRVYLFARPSDGALCVYNDSGATLHADLLVLGAGEPPSPSAPPPDVIPTLTEVQWLTPSLAAARPADPGGPAVHRATDTGAITLFDGGAWRDLTTTADPTGTATTTDTSWTTALAYELGGAGRVAAVQIRAAAVTDDGTAGAAWVGTVMARRPSAGAVVVGTAVWLLSDADGAGWEVQVVSDGADGIEVQVRGDPSPATELRWRVTATITEAT